MLGHFKNIKEYIGWEKNTTYTVIKRLIDKGAIRRGSGFSVPCNIQKSRSKHRDKALLNKLYNGSLIHSLQVLKNQDLSRAEIMELERILNDQRF